MRTLFLLGMLVAAGCGPATYGVSLKGRATYKGEPLSGMSLRFVGPDGREASASVGFEGVYEAAEVPTGSVAVGIVAPVSFGKSAPPPGLAASLPKVPRSDVKLPAKFRDPATSGLRFDITGSTSTLDIEAK